MTLHMGVLFKNLFSTEEMREIFGEENFIRKFLEVEAALARAEAKAGIIPQEAAEEITEKTTLEYVDMQKIEKNVEEIGLFSMSIIKAWKEEFGDAGEYIHWGATTQDISDTALVLQIEEAYKVILGDLDKIKKNLQSIADKYKDTPMIGRTHYVHAIPITFGLKASSWLDEVNRHIQRLEEMKKRLYAGEFFGATGSLASLGREGLEVQENLSKELGMEIPSVAWFASRDRLAEAVNLNALIASTLGKIAKNILIYNREEIREVQEHIPEGEVGSSTMPHKKNPVRDEMVLALSRIVKSHTSLMGELMQSSDERDSSTWFDEFAIIPENFLYVSRILENMKGILENLEIKPENMEKNLNIFGSLVTSEAIMMKLAEKIGRQTAHEVVLENAMEALQGDKDFEELLKKDERIKGKISPEELESLTDPTKYTGLSNYFAEKTIEESKKGIG